VPFLSSSADQISIIIVTLVISYISLVFGELAPKRIALEKAEIVSRFVAKPIEVLSKIASPFVKILTFSTNSIVKLVGINPEDLNQQKITEEEIRMMINVGEEKGVLMESEKEMIDSIFEFDDTFAKEVMTPRIDMICIPVDATLNEIMELTVKEQFSRLPVYKENIDNIIGILNIKDLFQVFESKKEQTFSVRDYLRPALFVPENQKTDILLKELQRKRKEIAIVIDEYGGTAGLVTIEDLVEEIVGNILDEYDEEEKEIEKIDDDTYIVDGMFSIGEVNEKLEIHIPEEGADTIGGFVLGILARIPELNEKPTIEYEDLVFKIEEMNERRAAKIKIGINRKVNEESEEE
jgi:putative hemolysin